MGQSVENMKPWFGPPPATEAPDLPGYQKLRMERLAIGRLSIVAIVLLPVWTFVFMAIVGLLGGRQSFSMELDLAGLITAALGLILVLVLVTLVHEAVHGLAGLAQGARPAFGIGPGFAYTTFFQPINRVSFLVIGISPLIVISIICVAIALLIPSLAGWMIFTAVFNATGAIGDIWMIWRVLRAPRGAVFFDLADGFMVYAPEPRS